MAATKQTRKKDVLLLILGQSNEGGAFADDARPVLGSDTVGLTNQTRYFVGYGHPFTTREGVVFWNDSDEVESSFFPASIEENAVIVNDSDLTYTHDTNSFVYTNSGTEYSRIGCPNNATGQWSHLADRLAEEKGYWVQVVDAYAKAGTSFITEWCGTTGSGDSRTVLNDGDVGFDPNSYIQDAYDAVSGWSSYFDELWVIVQHGQADAAQSGGNYASTDATTDAIQRGYYETALTNIVNFFDDVSPTQVFLSSSNQQATGGSSNDDSNGFENVIVQGMRNVMSALGANEGAMLSEVFGDSMNHNSRDNHLNRTGQKLAGEAWVSATGLNRAKIAAQTITHNTIG